MRLFRGARRWAQNSQNGCVVLSSLPASLTAPIGLHHDCTPLWRRSCTSDNQAHSLAGGDRGIDTRPKIFDAEGDVARHGKNAVGKRCSGEDEGGRRSTRG